MACSTNILTPFEVVWSAGSTSTTVDHPLTHAMNAADVHKVRVSFEGRSNSTAASLRGFYQYSNDGETWDTLQEIGPAFTATEGWSYDTAFTDISTGTPATRRIWVRFGVRVKNSTGTNIEYARARLRIDFEGAG